MGPHRFRNCGDDDLGHGVDHLGAGEDAHEDACCKDHGDDRRGIGTVGSDACLLFLVLVVDHQCQRSADDEQDGQRQHFHDQANHQHGNQCGIDPEFFRALQGGRFGIVAVHGKITRMFEFQLAQTGAFLHAPAIAHETDKERSQHHARNHRHKDLRGFDAERGQYAPRRAAPGNNVHHAVFQKGESGKNDRANAQFPMHRHHRRTGDKVGGRTVTVKRNERGEHGGANADLHRVAFDRFQDFLDDRVKEAGVDHDAEKEDGEADHDAGRRDLLHAIKHHLAQFGIMEPQPDGKNDRNQHQGVHRGHALGHDEIHEQGDHCESGVSQYSLTHGFSPIGMVVVNPSAQPLMGGTSPIYEIEAFSFPSLFNHRRNTSSVYDDKNIRPATKAQRHGGGTEKSPCSPAFPYAFSAPPGRVFITVRLRRTPESDRSSCSDKSPLPWR